MANVEDEPRGVRHKPSFSDEKARWDGDGPSGIAGPVPALRSRDWFGDWEIIAPTPEMKSVIVTVENPGHLYPAPLRQRLTRRRGGAELSCPLRALRVSACDRYLVVDGDDLYLLPNSVIRINSVEVCTEVDGQVAGSRLNM